MDEILYSDPLQRKAGVLIQLLIFSFTLNIGLIVTLCYQALSREPRVVYNEQQQPAICTKLSISSAEVVKELMDGSYQDVLEALEDRTHVQDGFRRRDLALACLVEYHFFDIARALSGGVLSKRILSFVHQEGGEIFYLPVFVGLEDVHFQLVKGFVDMYEWPLSPEGLFYELKERRERAPNSLINAFFATSHFSSIYTFFRRYDTDLAKEKLLLMLLEGPWEEIENFYKTWQGQPEITTEHIRTFLMEFIKSGSKYAASIWIGIDGEYLIRNLDDTDLFCVIDTVEGNLLEEKLFLKKLICSIRSDQIRRAAALKLFALEGEGPPEPYDHELVLKRFMPSMFGEEKKTYSYDPHYVVNRKHLVQKGDSLWKLSRRYGVSIEVLRKENRLQSDVLKPGSELVIPVQN